jgi:hypothetical protein
MRWAVHTACMGKKLNALNISTVKPGGKCILEGTGCDSADWIQLAQDRLQRRVLVNTVMNHRVP